MKKRTILYLSTPLMLLFFTFSLMAQSQRQTTIYGGITYGGIFARGTSHRGFNTPSGYMATGSGAGNGAPIWSAGAQARIETPFSRKIKVGLTMHYLQNIGPQQEGSFPPTVNKTGKISSEQHYSSFGGDGTFSYHLFPDSRFEIRLGTGASYIHRRFEYRNEFLFNIDADGNATLVRENFENKKQDTWGIPFTAQFSAPIAKKTTLGVHAAFRQYFNGDQQFVLTMEVGYRL